MAAIRRFLPGLLLAALLALPAQPVSAGPDGPVRALADGGTAVVTGIVDGDTVLLADGREVRLVGIQAPKLPLGRKNFRKWPLADRARSALETLTLGSTVFLAAHFLGATRGYAAPAPFEVEVAEAD